MTAGSSSRFVRASTARVEPSSGQVRIARSTRTISSDAIGREDQPPGRARSGPDDLREALGVVLDETDGAFDDRRGHR